VELHVLYSSPDFVIKVRQCVRYGNICRGKLRNAKKLLVEKMQRKDFFGEE
jgi:hypothetical protein